MDKMSVLANGVVNSPRMAKPWNIAISVEEYGSIHCGIPDDFVSPHRLQGRRTRMANNEMAVRDMVVERVRSRLGVISSLAVLLSVCPVGSTTLQDCMRWISSSPYHSREGLLQMFLQAARTDHVQTANLNRGMLQALKPRIETMFPLDETEQIRYSDSVLEIRFREPVQLVVPGTWRQTHVSMSPLVRFRVRPIETAPGGIEFEVLEGSVRLDFDWFARKFSGMPDHLEGRRLRYWSDDVRRVSGISLEQETRLAPGAVQITRGTGSLRFDCPAPYKPMEFTDTTVEYFGVRLLWRGDLLRGVDGKWRHDSAGVHMLSSLRPTLLNAIDSSGGKPALLIRESLNYRLEERKGSLSKAFEIERGK